MPRYNPAPGWPAAPAGWLPPRGWRPEPGWAPAPDGWQLVLPSDGELVGDPAAGKQRGRELREWTAAAAARYEVVSVAPSYGRPDPVRVGSRRAVDPLARVGLVLAVLVAPVGLVVSLVALLRVDSAWERGSGVGGRRARGRGPADPGLVGPHPGPARRDLIPPLPHGHHAGHRGTVAGFEVRVAGVR